MNKRKKDKKYAQAFGRNVRKLRDEKSWSQAQLGSFCDMTGQQISSIERGINAPNLHTIKDIALALGKYPDELLRFEYTLMLNKDFGIWTKKVQHPPIKSTLIKLIDSAYLDSPRLVAEIVAECQRLFKTKLKSPAVSTVLKRFVDLRKVKRIKSDRKRGSFEYQKR